MRVLVLASYDSFLNIGGKIAPFFVRAGCEVEYALVRARRKTQITDSQIAELVPGSVVRWIEIDEGSSAGEFRSYDIVLSCLEGFSTRRMMHHLLSLGERRPLVISIYPGLLLRHRFDGFSMRSASDLLWLNCQNDVTAYQEMCEAFGMDGKNARLLGVAPLLQRVEREAGVDDGPIVFFEQAVIPRYHDERFFLAEQLVLLAMRFPQREFVVKPRTVGKGATLHQTWGPIGPLLEKASEKCGGWPSNLSLTSEKASSLLSRASHCLTVCSTVSAEAIHAGVPTAIIGDFGAHDDYGLHYFFRSGLIRTFAELNFPFAVEPNQDWLAAHISDPNQTIEALVDEALQMAQEPRRAIGDAALKAEMSSGLRAHLYRTNNVEYVLGRKYQVRQKPNSIWATVFSAVAKAKLISIVRRRKRR